MGSAQLPSSMQTLFGQSVSSTHEVQLSTSQWGIVEGQKFIGSLLKHCVHIPLSVLQAGVAACASSVLLASRVVGTVARGGAGAGMRFAVRVALRLATEQREERDQHE